jgi:hypothetical protein
LFLNHRHCGGSRNPVSFVFVWESVEHWVFCMDLVFTCPVDCYELSDIFSLKVLSVSSYDSRHSLNLSAVFPYF